MDAAADIIQKRYNETRRRHPLADEEQELRQAILLENPAGYAGPSG
ncbi:MAG: hypothetical protein R3E89_13010 [Thiolinea sp.]